MADEKPKTDERSRAAKAADWAADNKGMLAGAAVGTAVVPVIGTFIGGAVGSLWDR